MRRLATANYRRMGRHLLVALLAIGLCTTLSGCRRKGQRKVKQVSEKQKDDEKYYCLYPEVCGKHKSR